MPPRHIYHITKVHNLASIIEANGLFSTNLLLQNGINHQCIAYGEIQQRRANTIIPCGPGGYLHDYVPFYFGPRSPMLYANHTGYVPGNQAGQRTIIHLVTSIEAISASGHQFVFSDGHPIMALSDFFHELDSLNQVDWALMQSKYWNDTPQDPDRKRRRQAEFLVRDFFQWELVSEIGVYDEQVKFEAENAIAASAHRPMVRIVRAWYY